MLLIQGEQQNDIWHGKVLRVDRAKLCTLLRNTRNLTSLFVRHWVELQEIQLLLIQYLQLQRDTGLVQIAGKKKFDLFLCYFSSIYKSQSRYFGKSSLGSVRKKCPCNYY